jgi:hypothetical protein
MGPDAVGHALQLGRIKDGARLVRILVDVRQAKSQRLAWLGNGRAQAGTGRFGQAGFRFDGNDGPGGLLG